MIRQVIVLEDAARDIETAIDFYEAAEPGVGDYFRDSIIADLRRLAHYFGQHADRLSGRRGAKPLPPIGIDASGPANLPTRQESRPKARERAPRSPARESHRRGTRWCGC